MPLNIRSNLLAKSALAVLAAVLLIQMALLWPESIQRKRAATAQVYEALSESAAADAGLKAEVLASGEYNRVENRFLLWQPERIDGVLALVDAQGRVLAASAPMPDMATGGGMDLLEEALEDGQARGRVGDSLAAAFALGPGGELGPDQEPLGAFVALANESDALGALAYRGGFADIFLMTVGALFSAALMLGIIYVLFVRPIRRLEARERQLDLESGHIEALGEEKLPTDELGSLARVRNRLLERLRESQALVRESQAMLDRAESRHRALMEVIPDIVFRMNPQGEFLFLSPSFERFTGLKPEDVYDSRDAFLAAVVAEDRTVVDEALGAVARGESLATLQFRLAPVRGNDLPLRVTLSSAPLADAQGNVQGVEGLLRREPLAEGRLPQSGLAHIEILAEMARALHSGPLREDIYEYAAEMAARIAGAERAVVAVLLEGQCQALGLYDLPEEARQAPLPLADTAEAKIIESRQSVALLTENAWSAFALSGPYVGVPVLDRLGQPAGLIACHGLPADTGTEALAALSLLAALILPALESERQLRMAAHVEERPRRKRSEKDEEDLSFFE